MVRAQNWLVPIVLLLVVTCARWGAAQATNSSGLDWQPTLEDAKRAAAKSNRLVLVHFTLPTDQACQALEREVYSQPAVQQQIHAKFVPFKVNVEDYPLSAKQYGIDRIPMDLVIDANSVVLGRMHCPPTADAYLASLESTVATARGARTVAQQPAVTTTTVPTTTPSTALAPTGRYTNSPQATPPVSGTSVQNSPPAVVTQPSLGNNVATTAPATTLSNPQPPAIAAYSDDRYTEFFKRTGTQPVPAPSFPAVVTPPAAPVNTATVQAPPAANTPSTMNSAPTWGTAGYLDPQNANRGDSPTNSASLPAAATTPAQVVAGAAPLGLEGFCPVTLTEQKRWQVGDRRWGVVHRGRTYLFAGPMEQKQFLASPDRYSPAVSGQDVVAAIDQGRTVDGQRQFGVQYQNRMYLFSNTATRDAFSKNPNRYVAEVLNAENSNRNTTWR